MYKAFFNHLTRNSQAYYVSDIPSDIQWSSISIKDNLEVPLLDESKNAGESTYTLMMRLHLAEYVKKPNLLAEAGSSIENCVHQHWTQFNAWLTTKM